VQAGTIRECVLGFRGLGRAGRRKGRVERVDGVGFTGECEGSQSQAMLARRQCRRMWQQQQPRSLAPGGRGCALQVSVEGGCQRFRLTPMT
jgi:hypothetical protein